MSEDHRKVEKIQDPEITDLLEVYSLNQRGVEEHIPLELVKFRNFREKYFTLNSETENCEDSLPHSQSIKGKLNQALDEVPSEIGSSKDSLEVSNNLVTLPIVNPLAECTISNSVEMRLKAFNALSFLDSEELNQDVDLLANLYQTFGLLLHKVKTTLPENFGPKTKLKLHEILNQYFDEPTIQLLQDYFQNLKIALVEHFEKIANGDFDYLIRRTEDGLRVSEEAILDQQAIFAISIADCSRLLAVLPIIKSGETDLDDEYLSSKNIQRQGQLTRLGSTNHNGTKIDLVGNKEYATHVVPNYLRLYQLQNKLKQSSTQEEQEEFASELVKIIKTQLACLRSGKASQSLLMHPGGILSIESAQKNNPKRQLYELQKIISDSNQLTIELEMIHLIQMILACKI